MATKHYELKKGYEDAVSMTVAKSDGTAVEYTKSDLEKGIDVEEGSALDNALADHDAFKIAKAAKESK